MLLPIILGSGKKLSKIIYIKGWSVKKMGIFSKIKLENTETLKIDSQTPSEYFLKVLKILENEKIKKVVIETNYIKE